MHNFKELKIWQHGMTLAQEIYILTRKFPSFERFGLISQMQRSASSIPTNIAEGSGRNSDKDFIRFLNISLGSSFELETQLILSFNLKYINEEEFNNMRLLIVEEQKMIFGFTNSLTNNINN